MKLQKLLLSVAISSCIALSPAHATEQEEETASIGELILDKAKSKLISGFGSLLADAVFGSGGPQYVMLSEASLQAIQDRVREEIVRDAEYDFIAEFRSLESSMEHYADTASHSQPDLALLTALLVKSEDVINHRALNYRYNDDYFYMADTYALAASVSIAIYTERHLEGYISKSVVSTKAHTLANTLENMLRKKKSADLPLRSGCEAPDPYDQVVEYACWLKDPYGNYLASYVVEPQYPGDSEYWDNLKDRKEAEYKRTKFDKIQSVINKLRNL
ncbi:hypothetical protein [Pseudoalteromonas luteoviolacea]|uniref:hypothetical protein n=1 Tax=Pseudoalteromonas luteoviolacea TaxID=43657 RepID=UPI0007B083B4|nr:hypothetical protein [Pseudoalteromonas luteoviolacea]KZN56942.1 hypothetical protein N474_09990 [Pseudoalteromonas luteoviolacea CPMOR-2]TQF67482.1 hypothetical protein FLM44_20060 [Pseudoalteromonas luteoviolacea]